MGLNVQGLLADDKSANKSETSETVKWPGLQSAASHLTGQPARYWAMAEIGRLSRADGDLRSLGSPEILKPRRRQLGVAPWL